MPYCPKCKTTVASNDSYCSECGRALKGSGDDGGAIVECSNCHGFGKCSDGMFKTKLCPACGGVGKVRL